VKIFTLILLFSSCACFAQEDFSSLEVKDSTDYNAFKEHVPYWRMEKKWKFSPFDVFSIIPSFGVDHEVKMHSGLSFQFGAAVIPSFLQFAVGNEAEQFDWMNGYRLRFESRFWGFKKPRLYIATEISMRHLIISDETNFGMEGDGNGNFAYFIKQSMIYNRFSTHFNLKMGWQFLFAEKLVVDTYIGLSFRRNNVISNSTPPEGGEAQVTWNRFEWELRNKQKFGYAVPIAGLKIGWHYAAKAAL
jgi:hypothetical protein